MSAVSDGIGPNSNPAVMPTGTVTFVFTDIEGSTMRWESRGAAMETAMRRHDAIVRDAIETHDGHVFKTVGDAFCAAFARPEDAVIAVLEAQRALRREDFSSVDGLSVRAAIHTGTADERDNDYFGPTVNRVARLLGIAHGGQVLLSGVTSDLLHGALPRDATLLALGEHRLKDLARPESVYQLVAPGLAAQFPPLRSLDRLPNNLPLQLKSFVGREAEVAQLTELVGTHRLVTIVGSGGIGKTRTSLQVAANRFDVSGDGVWFVELAPISSGALVPGTVANALGLTLSGDGDALANLVGLLGTKQALLVFDNCEHLVDATAATIAAILRACPKIGVLASSRQALGIDGEVTYRMPSLDLAAAVALFVERAKAADMRFALDDDNAPVVADICRRLDGIALAIELAASRVTILGPRQLRDRLDERFRVLTGGSRDLLPRQQTLRALIDWSHDLLDENERVLFRRLGIFVNGFTIEGAIAVGSGEAIDEFEIIDLVGSLVEKSLVLVEPAREAFRYRLLESTRAYALQKLDLAGERNEIAGRHLRYLRDRFLAIDVRRDETARTGERDAAFAVELEDIRVALDGALARPDVVAGAELLAALARVWVARFGREGLARHEAVIAALPETESRLHARLSATLASFLVEAGDARRGVAVGAKACAFARSCGDDPALASALNWYALCSARAGDLAEAERALAEFAAIPKLSVARRVLLLDTRAFIALVAGDLDAAASAFEQVVAEQRLLGNTSSVYVATANLAEIEHRRGHTERAIALVRAVLPDLQTGAERRFCAVVCSNLAGYLIAHDESDAAIDAARAAIESMGRSEPEDVLVTAALTHFALAVAVQGPLALAARLAAYASAAFTAANTDRQFTEATSHDRLVALLDERLGSDERRRLEAEGASLGAAAAVALALEHASQRV